ETINAMLARLERSFVEMRRFTADASHELRSPLTVIRTEAEVALRGPIGKKEGRELLGSVLEECERLSRLTEQLLALAREDTTKTALNHEPIDLASLVQHSVEAMTPLADARGVTIRCQAPIDAWWKGDK